MSKEFQIRDGNLIASFDLENEDGDIDFCKLLKVSHGVADEIGMFVDYVATNKIIKDQSKKITDLETKLAECEKSKESYRLQNEQHHLQLLQFYSRLGVEAFGADIHEKALETLMIMKDQLAEKDKQIAELKKQLEEKDKTIQGLIEEQKCLERSCSYQMFLDIQKQLAENEKEISEYIKIVDDLHKQLSDKCDFCDKTKDQDKISFALEQLEKARKLIDELLDNCGDKQYKVWEVFDNQIKQLKEGK